MKNINKMLIVVLMLCITLSMGCIGDTLMHGESSNEDYTVLKDGSVSMFHIGEDFSSLSLICMNIEITSDKPVDIYLLRNDRALSDFLLDGKPPEDYEHYEEYEAIQVTHYDRTVKKMQQYSELHLVILHTSSVSGEVANIKVTRTGNKW